MKAKLPLKKNEVDIWLVSLAEMDDHIRQTCQRFLSESELTQWRRFLAQAPRDQYLIARALVRMTLSRYTGAPEAMWRFVNNHYGRPGILEPTEFRHIQFNLSHTEGLVALSISTTVEIGIDVENIRREIAVQELASSFFAPAEAEVVARSALPEAREAFFSLWTLKESYIKARGMGLSIPLDSFWFELKSPSPILHCETRCNDEAGRWQFHQFAPTANHRLALAIGAPPCARADIHVRWIEEPLVPRSATNVWRPT